MRQWRPPDAPASDEWQVVHQIIVPITHHREVISIAHDSPMAGHLGVRKTHDRILNHFGGLHSGRMFLSIVDLATLVKWWATLIRRSLLLH